MFFWLFMAALMGLIMFGNLHDQTKDEKDYIQPAYETLGATMLQFHNAAVYGYETTLRSNLAGATAYWGDAGGMIPLISIENNTYTDGKKDPGDPANVFHGPIRSFLPFTFRTAGSNGTRSYLVCLSKDNEQPLSCNSAALRYIVTYREIPPRYDGADKYLALRALSTATDGSRQIGILAKTDTPLAAGDGVYHQPIGSVYYIQTSGSEHTTANYIPKYIICNAPTKNSQTGSDSIGHYLNNGTKKYLFAMTLVRGGETHNENFQDNVACTPLSGSE